MNQERLKTAERPATTEATVSRKCRVVPGLIVVAAALVTAQAQAQSNIDAGKSPAQIFVSTCNACHRSPRELKPTSAGFLREHYMTGAREAAAMAAYLGSIGSDPRAVQQRRAPVLGAGQAALPEGRASQSSGGDQAKSPAAATRVRRPSDSTEVAAGPETDAEVAAAPVAASPERPPLEPFEE
jgi:hypothetical protein